MTDLPPVPVLEVILHKALQDSDMEGVVHVLRLISAQDPHRAEVLLNTIRTGIAISQERQETLSATR